MCGEETYCAKQDESHDTKLKLSGRNDAWSGLTSTEARGKAWCVNQPVGEREKLKKLQRACIAHQAARGLMFASED